MTIFLTALCFSSLRVASGHAQDPSKADIARQAKAAAALVEVAGGFKHGSAFCVHGSGLFISNEHVVRGAAEVKLILHPGLKNQQIVRARVLRLDKNLDLALLRVLDKADFSPLALGSSEDLAELAEVIAVGFPFGKGLALEKGEYPAVSVNTGRITALRLKKGELERIQMDAVVNPGNSGGPVLDSKGKVIGVVVSGVFGATVNFAIPVSHVHRFVATPEIEISFSSIAYADRYKPAVFQIRAVTLVPGKADFEVELILGGKRGAERSFKMTLQDGFYRTIAEAMKQEVGPNPLRVTLTYPGGSIEGTIADRSFTIGKDELKLNAIRSLRFGKEPAAILANGQIATGVLSGLDELPLQLGSDTLKVVPAKALELTVHPIVEETKVSYTVIVTKGGKEVARVNDVLAFRDVPSAPVGGDPIKIGIAPPVLERDATTIELPSTVGDVAVGGGGRFLILHFPKSRALGIFDVSQARLVRTLPLSEDSVRFAAGMDKLVIGYPNSNIFQRFSLSTFERETVKPVELKGKLHGLAMGSASRGPIFVAGAQGPGDVGAMVTFLDLDFGIMNVDMKGARIMDFREGGPVRASANGRVFTTWGNGSPAQLQAIVVDGLQSEFYGTRGSPGAGAPSHDGSIIYTSRGGLWTWQVKEIDGTNKGPRTFSIPAHGYPYHLGVRAGDGTRPSSDPGKGVTVHIAGDGRVIANLPHVDDLQAEIDHWGRSFLTADKRLHFIPDAKVIVALPYSNDKLVLHRFDMDAALSQATFDYLFVTSTPPTLAKKGETFRHAMSAKSKRGGVAYKLLNGPPDMSVTPSGQLSWDVPMTFNGADADVLIAVSDASRQEIFHSFKLKVR